MKLKEAIEHAGEKACELQGCDCGNEHLVLSNYLQELQSYRKCKKYKKKIKKFKSKATHLIFYHYDTILKVLDFYLENYNKNHNGVLDFYLKNDDVDVKTAKRDFENFEKINKKCQKAASYFIKSQIFKK